MHFATLKFAHCERGITVFFQNLTVFIVFWHINFTAHIFIVLIHFYLFHLCFQQYVCSPLNKRKTMINCLLAFNS